MCKGELHDLYGQRNDYWGHQIKEGEMDCTCGRCGGETNAYRVCMGNAEVKRPLPRTRPRWEGKMSFNFKEIEQKGMGWISLAQDREN